MNEGVVVRAPARLHFGVLDLRGDLGRRFGGLGAAVEEPGLELVVRPASALVSMAPVAGFPERTRFSESGLATRPSASSA
jgi:predicted sugar kinase